MEIRLSNITTNKNLIRFFIEIEGVEYGRTKVTCLLCEKPIIFIPMRVRFADTNKEGYNHLNTEHKLQSIEIGER